MIREYATLTRIILRPWHKSLKDQFYNIANVINDIKKVFLYNDDESKFFRNSMPIEIKSSMRIYASPI